MFIDIYLKRCLLCTLFLAAACTSKRPAPVASPRGYDLSKPQEIKLPVELDEISGLTYSAKDTSLFAIQDERGYLYKLFPLRNRPTEKWRFAPGGDYEDVVLLGKTFYVMNSSGDITLFRFEGPGKLVGQEVPFEVPDGNGGEFEALYWEPKLQRLVLICKDCRLDKKKDVSCYTFDTTSLRYDLAPLSLDAEGVAATFGQKSVRFKASAAAIHPVTGDLYVVSAVNKVLVVFDRSGRTQKVYPLPAYFKQPEGIAFSPRGTLFISNEAAGVGVADIQIFPYNRSVPAPAP